MIQFAKLWGMVLGLLILAACAGQQADSAASSPTSAAASRAQLTQPPAMELAPPTQPLPAATPLPGPDCAIGLPPTRPDMEGPYFLAGSPEKASLIEPGMSGTPLSIHGYVLTVDCKWVPGARLEFWQADASGEYDLQGYRLRGHVFSDENGRYRIETILPAPYGNRPRHIHVMVLPPSQPGLTTQLYFPGDSPYPELTVALSEGAQGAAAEFNFVLDLR
jgi:protocatechuate 3,4-dioxygenase beta subunit